MGLGVPRAQPEGSPYIYKDKITRPCERRAKHLGAWSAQKHGYLASIFRRKRVSNYLSLRIQQRLLEDFLRVVNPECDKSRNAHLPPITKSGGNRLVRLLQLVAYEPSALAFREASRHRPSAVSTNVE